jgi:hypothetical protein
LGHTEEAIRRADALFLKTFRPLVDQWIDSGINEDGTETPSRRYIRSASIDSGINHSGTEATPRKYAPGVPKGYPVELFEILLGWLSRNLPKPAPNNDGTIAILDGRPMPTGTDLETYARESAIFFLKELFECPAPCRLRRCRNESCRTYSARTRARNEVIKRGTYCGKCVLAAAAERTKLSGQRRKNRQLELAAKAWLEWKKSNTHPRQPE